MKIAAIMPCMGRPEQTEQNLIRLMKQADFPCQFICIAFEPEVWKTLKTMGVYSPDLICLDSRVSYWEAMRLGMKMLKSDTTHIVNLANDLLPGRQWLRKCYETYERRFDNKPGLMGFNDGIHGPELSSHFLIDMRLLDELGGWPIWYDHNYGDLEICTRAQEMKVYGKSAWAVLYHNHPATSGPDDAIYARGSERHRQDYETFRMRRDAHWNTSSISQWEPSPSTALPE